MQVSVLRSDPSRPEQAYQSMSGAIRVENIRDGATRSDQTDMRRIIRLDQSGVKASEEKTRQIRVDQEHHGERGDPCQKIKEKCSEKIRAESEKSSVDQSRSSSVVQNDAE